MDAIAHLNIADINFRLRLPQSMQQALQQRYAGFVAEETQRDAFAIDIVADERLGHERFLPRADRHDNTLTLTDGTFRLTADLKTRRAELACPRPVVDTPSAELPTALRGGISALLAALLPRHNGMLLHASGVVVREVGVIFVGVSGAGKSTTCGMFPEADGLNDELVAIRDLDGRPTVHATPFSGDLDLPRRQRGVPLALACLLEQAAETRLLPASASDAYATILRSATLAAGDGAAESNIMQLAQGFVERVPWRRLQFTLDPQTLRDTIERAVVAATKDIQLL